MTNKEQNTHKANSDPVVIKVGGSFFSELAKPGSEQSGAQSLLKTIASLQQARRNVVLVHGGGEQVLARMAALGIQSIRKDGLRVTPDEHMPIVSSVLAGELNKQLVATCAKFAVNAVGISLADGNMASCHEHPADIGAVGVPKAQQADLLEALFSANMVPVIASIGKDDNGRLYNVNADHAAICIAELLQTQLYFFADVRGVLDGNKQLITELSPQLSKTLIADGVITDGMIVKVQAAQSAANAIHNSVMIASWDNAQQILIEHKLMGTQVLPGAVAH